MYILKVIFYTLMGILLTSCDDCGVINQGEDESQNLSSNDRMSLITKCSSPKASGAEVSNIELPVYESSLAPPSFSGIAEVTITSLTSGIISWPTMTNGGVASKYLIYKNKAATVNFSDTPFAVMPFRTNNFSVSGLETGTQYSFAVRACTHDNLCDSNTIVISRTSNADTTPPVINDLDYRGISDETTLSSAGISVNNPGKVWKAIVSATDDSGIKSLKVFRKLSNSGNDFPTGNEAACSSPTQTNCMVGSSSVNTVTSSNDVNQGSIEVFANYLIIAEDGWGNITTKTESFDARYAVKVSSGDNHTCAEMNTGGILCWGHGAYGQLGYGDNNDLNVNTERIGSKGYLEIIDGALDAGATGIIELKAKSNRTCALLSNGRIKCWGQGAYLTRNVGSMGLPFTGTGCWNKVANWPARRHDTSFNSGQTGPDWFYNILANDGLTTFDKPKNIASFEIHSGEVTSKLEVSDQFQCATISDTSVSNAKKVKCWGKSINHSRAWTGWGSRYGYGHHQSGCLLGNGTRDYINPVKSGYSCGFWGWGFRINAHWNACSDSNKLPENNSFVVDIAGKEISKISSGKYHSCALYDDGKVRCWGGETAYVEQTGNAAVMLNVLRNRQLGIGGVNYGLDRPNDNDWVPIIVEDPLNPGTFIDEQVLQLTSSSTGTCALLGPTPNSGETQNKVRCWGSNFNGELGQGNTTDYVTYYNTISRTDNTNRVVAPAIDFGNEQITKIFSSTSNGSYCALTNNNDLYCWGENDANGLLGSGDIQNIGDDELPKTNKVNFSSKVLDVSMGDEHACAVLVNGDLQCWGSSSYSKIGVVNATALLEPSEEKAVNFGFVAP